MNNIRKILFPLVPVYFVVTWLRNKLYDWGLKGTKSYDLPIICVGNLNTGGTGKSPMIEYLIRFLMDDYKLATLSRGYKRSTKGFLLAKKGVKSLELGDEPYQIYNKFKSVHVAVDENRQRGIAKLRQLFPDIQSILLDDAFQHRKVTAGLNILLTPFNRLYCDDMVLPTGDLREPRSGANRAHIIVVTKCPESLTEVEKKTIELKLKLQKNQKLFFSTISYSKTVVSKHHIIDLKTLKNFSLVTGIANARPLVTYLKSLGLEFKHLEFSDHHAFSKKEVDQLNKFDTILTTEKDFVRLKDVKILEDKIYHLPIELTIDRAKDFKKIVKTFIKKF